MGWQSLGVSTSGPGGGIWGEVVEASLLGLQPPISELESVGMDGEILTLINT